MRGKCCLGGCTRLLGKATTGKEGVSRALRRYWEHLGWRRNYFRGWRKLESKIQPCLTARERLQLKACLPALLPKICHVGELMLGKGVGGRGPRSLRGHGGDQPAGMRTPGRHPHNLQALGWWPSPPREQTSAGFCNSLKKCYQAMLAWSYR